MVKKSNHGLLRGLGVGTRGDLEVTQGDGNILYLDKHLG